MCVGTYILTVIHLSLDDRLYKRGLCADLKRSLNPSTMFGDRNQLFWMCLSLYCISTNDDNVSSSTCLTCSRPVSDHISDDKSMKDVCFIVIRLSLSTWSSSMTGGFYSTNPIYNILQVFHLVHYGMESVHTGNLPMQQQIIPDILYDGHVHPVISCIA